MINKIKIYFFLFTLIFVLSCGPRYTRQSYSSAATNPYSLLSYIKNSKIEISASKPSDPLLAILWKYSPDAFYLVQIMENMPKVIKIGNSMVIMDGGPGKTVTTGLDGKRIEKIRTGKGFRHWIDEDKSFEEQEKQIETAVHEICHGYTSKNASYLFSKKINNIGLLMHRSPTDPRKSYFIGFDSFYRNKNTTLYTLKRTKSSESPFAIIFPAKEIIKMIPENKRTFRFKTYIMSYHSAQVTGISGLLDEYNAYYWSTKVAYDFYDFYKNEKQQTVKNWIDWFKQIGGVYFAYTEFRYWMLNYLIYAKKNRPDVYKSLMNDKHLRNAFTMIDDDFTDLIKKYFQRIFVELPSYLEKFNFKVSVIVPKSNNTTQNKSMEYIYRIHNHSCIMFSKYYIPLQEEMLKQEFIQIANEFRLTPQADFPVLNIPEKLRSR